MPTVRFTRAIQRHVTCPDLEVAADTVRAALDAYFEQHPAARHYVMDETGAVRRHVAVFVNDRQVLDRTGLADPLAPTDEVFVYQALSGG